MKFNMGNLTHIILVMLHMLYFCGKFGLFLILDDLLFIRIKKAQLNCCPVVDGDWPENHTVILNNYLTQTDVVVAFISFLIS